MVSDPRFTEFANRIAAQCVRLGGVGRGFGRHECKMPQASLRHKAISRLLVATYAAQPAALAKR